MFMPAQCRLPEKRPCSIFTHLSMTTRKPGGEGLFGRFQVDDPQLRPNGLGPDRDCLVDNRRDLVGRAENIDQIDLVRNALQVRIDRFAQDRSAARIDRDDAVALVLQIGGHEVAGLLPVRREAHHGDGLRRAEQVVDAVGILVEGLLLRCQNGVEAYSAASA